jgi:hypothetical protein
MVLQDHQTDAPLLPVASIERLHQVRPDRVDWVFEQTQIEAENRRIERHRTNLYIFIERMVGMVFALTIGLSGILGGLYAAIQGHEWLGGVVATVTIGTLAGNFLIQRKK